MKGRALLFLFLYLSFVSAMALVTGTGLIPDWGLWYSPSLAYRQQTDAFLGGGLALSTSPALVGLDMVWSAGGVHQVWGLGVPAWRMPFEIVAQLAGQPGFPDRLAFAAALFGYSFLILWSFTHPPEGSGVGSWIRYVRSKPEVWMAAWMLIFFPPLITFFRGPFNVYEEAVAYGCIYSIGLFAGLVAFNRHAVPTIFWILCFAAGFAGFLRPTMLAYGLTSVVFACWIAKRCGWKWRMCLGGLAAFGVGVALLWVTNWVRYESGTEFGHQLNLSSLDLIYTSRFGSPFDSVSSGAALRELFGATFFVPELNGFAVYAEGVIPGQAESPRWRHFYHTTFDLSFLALVIGGWILGLRNFGGGSLLRKRSRFEIPELAAVWSMAALLPIAIFLLRFHAMSSRYILDFAPGFAVAVVGCLYGLAAWGRRRDLGPRAAAFAVAMFAIWWGWQGYSGQLFFPPGPVFDQARVLAVMPKEAGPALRIPLEYGLDQSFPGETLIYGNGMGWERDGGIDEGVVLFVENPRRLTVDLGAGSGGELRDEDCAHVRAKVGLEELELIAVEVIPEGRRLHFAGPRRRSLREGTQVVFVGLSRTIEFLVEKPSFRLLNVEWRESAVRAVPEGA